MQGNPWLATPDHGLGFGLEPPLPTVLAWTQSLHLSELPRADQTP